MHQRVSMNLQTRGRILLYRRDRHTCCVFQTTSFLESEVYRQTGKQVRISERLQFIMNNRRVKSYPRKEETLP
jgi:hypothetical protein